MAKKEATYADLEALPDHLIGEIIDGELIASPLPRPRHGHTTVKILAQLSGPFSDGKGGPGGWWILVEPEIRFGSNVMVPDAAGWRRDRVPVLPDIVPLEIAPQWACEVLSPSTAKIDREKKLRIYARYAVDHVWLVDPVLRTLEIYERTDKRWTLLDVHSDDARVRAAPFDAIELDLSTWWMPLASGAAEPQTPQAIDWHREPL
ncbi:MAG TPA: Uma2 family endonuclease [Kofleriaceae bacterium]|nr:Uma2 family endonuclease [Kofleriaceae bacterium]